MPIERRLTEIFQGRKIMIGNYILKQRIATVLISILLSVIVSTNSNSANSSGLSTQTEEPSPAASQLRVIDSSWDLDGTGSFNGGISDTYYTTYFGKAQFNVNATFTVITSGRDKLSVKFNEENVTDNPISVDGPDVSTNIEIKAIHLQDLEDAIYELKIKFESSTDVKLNKEKTYKIVVDKIDPVVKTLGPLEVAQMGLVTAEVNEASDFHFIKKGLIDNAGDEISEYKDLHDLRMRYDGNSDVIPYRFVRFYSNSRKKTFSVDDMEKGEYYIYHSDFAANYVKLDQTLTIGDLEDYPTVYFPEKSVFGREGELGKLEVRLSAVALGGKSSLVGCY
jgi:hypothetical protein